MPENLVSRDGFSRSVPRQPAHLRTQAESGAYLRDSSRVPRRCPFIKPPYAIGSVPSLSGHAIAYRWRSLPRVRRHRASKPQGSSERVLPWQVTMDQLICASLSHTHYWYEGGMLKVPAEGYGRQRTGEHRRIMYVRICIYSIVITCSIITGHKKTVWLPIPLLIGSTGKKMNSILLSQFVRARDLFLARQVRPSRPVSARLLSRPRLNR